MRRILALATSLFLVLGIATASFAKTSSEVKTNQPKVEKTMKAKPHKKWRKHRKHSKKSTKKMESTKTDGTKK